jgi:hypothetical protein
MRDETEKAPFLTDWRGLWRVPDRSRARMASAGCGREASSHGPREQGTYAAEFYTTVKIAYIRP